VPSRSCATRKPACTDALTRSRTRRSVIAARPTGTSSAQRSAAVAHRERRATLAADGRP
jgi:hypothetical protein